MSPGWDEPIREELLQVEEELRKSIQSREKLLTEISLHVIGSGGKRIRPGVSILSYRAVGGKNPEKIIGIAAAFELIHSATLIHDDINDGGQMRRGVVAAYRKYGIQEALITGDFLFVKGFRLGGSLGQELVNMIADACASMAESEILQTKHELDPDTPIDTYFRIIEGKTARPIEVGARTGATLGGGTRDQIQALAEYGLNIGIAFQIVDDILDITGDEKELGKPRGMDIIEGKPTLPLLLAMNGNENGVRLREIFVKKKKTEMEVREMIEYLSRSAVIRDSRKHALRFAKKAIGCLAAVPDSEYKEALIRLANTVVNRRF